MASTSSCGGKCPCPVCTCGETCACGPATGPGCDPCSEFMAAKEKAAVTTIEDAQKRTLIEQGAEARVYTVQFLGRKSIAKERFPKKYRHPTLDAKLTKQRTVHEAKALVKCRENGIRTPTLYFIDLPTGTIYMEYFDKACTLKDYFRAHGVDAVKHSKIVQQVGETLAKMHLKEIIHGDLTTSNMMLEKSEANSKLVLIDFGLSQTSTLAEDKAVDLYVLERAFASIHPDSDSLFAAIMNIYEKSSNNKSEANKLLAVVTKLEEVRWRGRKRSMLG